jgi:UMF1 family MFS transporter
LGAVSDAKAKRKVFLIFFTLLSVVFTMSLGLTSNILLALVFFAIANFGCQEAIIFYNALMLRVAPKGKVGFVSGLGRMFGYSGAILALIFTKPVILNMGYQPTFVVTGALFLIFALPCMIFIKDKPRETGVKPVDFNAKERFLQVFSRLKEVIFGKTELKGFKNLLRASFFVLCAVNTIILFMSVYAGKAFGLDEVQTINLIVFSTLFAILGSILSGYLSDFLGYRQSLMAVFLLWGVCILTGALLGRPFHWLIGALAGMSLGSTWVVLRALVIKLVPEERIGEAFGLFNLVSYFSGVVGPLLWGFILLFLSRFGEWGYRAAFFSLISLVLIAVAFLLKVRSEEI